MGFFARELGKRLGTAIGTFLGGLGVAAADINIIVAATPVVLGVLADLAVKAYRIRR